MARRPVKAQPSTRKELKDTLWKAADKLRGSMSAAQYKDVVLGLIFLKYVSDAFNERREQITEELRADGYDDEAIAETLRTATSTPRAPSGWIPTPAGTLWWPTRR